MPSSTPRRLHPRRHHQRGPQRDSPLDRGSRRFLWEARDPQCSRRRCVREAGGRRRLPSPRAAGAKAMPGCGLGQLKLMSAIESARSAASRPPQRCEDAATAGSTTTPAAMPPAFARGRGGLLSQVPGAAANDWLAARAADLLPVGYFHLVFTLPADRPIAYRTSRWSTTVVPHVVRDHCHNRRDHKHPCPVGATAVLHTWGSAMTHHPLPYDVPGGISSTAALGALQTGFLLPWRILSRLFRRLFLARLRHAHAEASWVFGEIEACVAGRPSSRTSRLKGRNGSSRQAALTGPRRCSCLSRSLHPPRRISNSTLSLSQ